jgi:hypothetical protein
MKQLNLFVCVFMAGSLFAALLCPPRKQPRRIGRQGGWRQRQATEAAAANETPRSDDNKDPIGQLGPGMLLDFCDGWLSAYRLCIHMKRASDDGASCRVVKALGNIANSSTPYRHCNEGVFNFLGGLEILNIISTIDDSSWTHFIKPTNLMSLMQRHYPREFRLRFGADTATVKSFWQMFFSSAKRTQWASEHEFLRGKTVGHLSQCIPITVHQDAGPVAKTKSADCISVSSLLAVGGEKVTKFLLATALADKDNDWKVWGEILKDLDEAATVGVGGWKLVLLFAKADEEQRSIKWGLPSYNDSMEM